jgi:carboxyl-terminal processing protease
MKVTTALFFLPGGKSTQKMGVESDVRLPTWLILEDIGERALDYALPVQAIAPFIGVPGAAPPRWIPLEKPMIALLAARSKTRVAKDAKFAEIIKNNQEAAARKGIVRLADLRQRVEKESRDGQKETPAELRKKARDQYAPFVNESVNVLLDMVTLGQSLRVAGPIR